MYTDEDIASFTGIPIHTVTQARREGQNDGDITPVKKRPLLLDLEGATALCRRLNLDMTTPKLQDWLEAQKNARTPQDATVLPTRWRNPRLLKAMLKTTGEAIRVRVKNAAVWRAGGTIRVIPEDEYLWILDPEWSALRRKKATKGRVRP